MTTTWGADPAPHIAYQLTAYTACGREKAVAVLWLSLDDAGRARVVAALGAQARAVLEGPGPLLDEALGQLRAELRHCGACQAALDALAGCPAAELLPCDGCARPALALARVRMRALARFGFCPAAVAEICRRAAAL